jgi:hypothetical protein
VEAPPWFADILSRYDRVAISGGPDAGKSTLAGTVTDRPVFGTDDTIATHRWEDVPGAVISKSKELGDRWVIEGVQVPRALRKGLSPDVVIHLEGSYVPHNTMQASMGKAIATVLEDYIALRAAAVRVPVIRVRKGQRL